jgi:hydrogenase-4 membrane subunit HyfE
MKDGERRGGLLLGLLELEEGAGVLRMLLLVCCPLLVEGGVMLVPACVAVAIGSR